MHVRRAWLLLFAERLRPWLGTLVYSVVPSAACESAPATLGCIRRDACALQAAFKAVRVGQNIAVVLVSSDIRLPAFVVTDSSLIECEKKRTEGEHDKVTFA